MRGGPPVIAADRSDFQDLIETARRIAGQATEFLDKTNKLLDDNSGSISASVKNVQKFSDAARLQFRRRQGFHGLDQ